MIGGIVRSEQNGVIGNNVENRIIIARQPVFDYGLDSVDQFGSSDESRNSGVFKECVRVDLMSG